MFEIKQGKIPERLIIFSLVLFLISGCDSQEYNEFDSATFDESLNIKIQHPTTHPEYYLPGYKVDYGFFDEKLSNRIRIPLITIEENFPEQAMVLLNAGKDTKTDIMIEQAKYQRLRFSDDYSTVRVYYSDSQKPIVDRAFYLVEFIGPGVSNMQTQVLEPWYTKLKRWFGLLKEEE